MLNEEMSSRQISTPIGMLTATAAGGSISSLRFADAGASVTRPRAGSPVLDDLATQLAEYFAGARQSFDLPLMPVGTPFQKLVWWALRDIGYGQTCTYGDIAQQLGKAPGASRAIGGANGKNPIVILIPCHRVVAAGGKLGGYSAGGPDVKRWLLDLESSGDRLFC